jgi:hypothetical protein
MLCIIVEPALKLLSRRRAGESEFDPGRFTARIDGRVLVQSSRQPFLEAATVLVAQGYHPGAMITMRHAGGLVDALRAKLGGGAGDGG